MTGAPPAVELGEGAGQVLAVDGRGRVVAVYRRAAYLRLPAGLVALVVPGVWRGPSHVRCGARPGLLAPGDRVDVAGGASLRIGGVVVDLSRATVWRGRLPAPEALAAASAAIFESAPPTALLDPRYADRLAGALHRLDHDDLDGVARALGGLGPGLTPAGDDVLAGILLVRRALGGDAAGPRLEAAVRAVRTTWIAKEMLVWAARGQAVEPVHDLLVALAGGDGPRAAASLAALARLGHTSGADLAFGLAMGLGLRTAHSPRTRNGVARVSPG